jgi:glycosyltransferase involved in cell wall biosynthesis
VLPDRPIRVLRVIARLNVGGPALHVSYLSRLLDERGYQTSLAAGSVGKGEGSMEYVSRSLGIEPLFIPGLQREIGAGEDASAVRRLVELIRRLRPDVLHTHTAKAGAVGRAAAMLSGSARPPVVVHTFHGHVLQGYFGPLHTEVFRSVERTLARVSDALIAVSPQVRDDLVALGVADTSKFAVIRLGLELEERIGAQANEGARIRTELGLAGNKLLVSWFGRMTEIKRVDDLLRSFAALRAQDVDADLLLVGDGPLRPSLERLAHELGLASSTHFVGFRSDVAPYYAASDIVALSSASEGTPVSIIEAQAAGLPVVATDVGGVSDVVVDGETGFLVPPDASSAFADRLARLASDAALRTEMGRRGRDRVVSRYGLTRLVDDIDRLYRTLLDVSAPAERRVFAGFSVPLEPAIASPAVIRSRVGRTRRRMRVLLVSQYFPPEVGATQTRMQSFAEYLAARGHEVTVVCEFPNHPIGIIPRRYHGRYLEDDRTNGYRILRTWVRASEEKTPETRIAFYVSFMATATAVAPLVGRIDVVVATTPPLFAAVAGKALAALKRAPFVLDVRDLWPAAAISLNQISDGLGLRAAEALESFLYRRADAVVAVTRPFCAHIDEIRDRGSRAVHIPNGTLERFLEAPAEASRESLGVPDDAFLVTFAGTHGIAQALPTVLDAAERTNGDAVFALIGEGPLKASLVENARDRKLKNVRFYSQVEPSDVPPLLAASDALLVSLSEHPTFADFVPSKMIDYMAVGRPVILSAAGESARLLELAGAGVVVRPEDADALAAAVRRLADDGDLRAAMGARGRAFARHRLRVDQAARLEQVLFEVSR